MSSGEPPKPYRWAQDQGNFVREPKFDLESEGVKAITIRLDSSKGGDTRVIICDEFDLDYAIFDTSLYMLCERMATMRTTARDAKHTEDEGESRKLYDDVMKDVRDKISTSLSTMEKLVTSDGVGCADVYMSEHYDTIVGDRSGAGSKQPDDTVSDRTADNLMPPPGPVAVVPGSWTEVHRKSTFFPNSHGLCFRPDSLSYSPMHPVLCPDTMERPYTVTVGDVVSQCKVLWDPTRERATMYCDLFADIINQAAPSPTQQDWKRLEELRNTTAPGILKKLFGSTDQDGKTGCPGIDVYPMKFHAIHSLHRAQIQLRSQVSDVEDVVKDVVKDDVKDDVKDNVKDDVKDDVQDIAEDDVEQDVEDDVEDDEGSGYTVTHPFTLDGTDLRMSWNGDQKCFRVHSNAAMSMQTQARTDGDALLQLVKFSTNVYNFLTHTVGGFKVDGENKDPRQAVFVIERSVDDEIRGVRKDFVF